MSAQKRVTTQFEYLAGIAYNVLPEQVLEWNSSTAAGGIASALQMAKAVRNRTRFFVGGGGERFSVIRQDDLPRQARDKTHFETGFKLRGVVFLAGGCCGARARH